MPSVSPKHKNESFESMLRRFKNAVDDSDILKTLRKYEFYERPGDKRKRAKAAAVKRQERITLDEYYVRNGITPPKPKKEEKNYKKKETLSTNSY